MTPAERTALVTGATSGIGLAAARALAQAGFTVVLVSRNPEKCAATAEELRRSSGNARVDHIGADLSLMQQVRNAAAEFRARYPRLRVLVNNAGISPARRRETAEGLEQAFALNHLGHFLLTTLLLDRLRSGAPARVITVSSNVYTQARLDLDDLQSLRRFSALRVYANSKLANLLFTTELARRLQGSGVTANAMTPGMVKSNIGMDEGALYAFGKRLADFFGGKSPEQGADTIVWLATAPELEGVSGRYFQNRRELALTKSAADAGLAVRLWQVSEELTGPAR